MSGRSAFELPRLPCLPALPEQLSVETSAEFAGVVTLVWLEDGRRLTREVDPLSLPDGFVAELLDFVAWATGELDLERRRALRRTMENVR